MKRTRKILENNALKSKLLYSLSLSHQAMTSQESHTLRLLHIKNMRESLSISRSLSPTIEHHAIGLLFYAIDCWRASKQKMMTDMSIDKLAGFIAAQWYCKMKYCILYKKLHKMRIIDFLLMVSVWYYSGNTICV